MDGRRREEKESILLRDGRINKAAAPAIYNQRPLGYIRPQPNTEQRVDLNFLSPILHTRWCYALLLYTKSQVIMAGTSQAAAVVLLHSILGYTQHNSVLKLTQKVSNFQHQEPKIRKLKSLKKRSVAWHILVLKVQMRHFWWFSNTVLSFFHYLK